MVSWNFRQVHLQHVDLMEIPGDQNFKKLKKFQHNRCHDRLQDKQTPPSSCLELIEFETYYIKQHPLLFFLPTKYATVPQHGPFSLHTMLEGP